MFDWRDYGNGIVAFDAGYVRPVLAAIHMVIENGRVAFIDTGSNDALPNALAALRKLGLDASAVDYVMLTHIHLDHAGGAGSMMRACPEARLVVHPRGARHMAEPSKLVAGVTAVYGADYVQRVYGEILPIPVERIIEAPDGHYAARLRLDQHPPLHFPVHGMAEPLAVVPVHAGAVGGEGDRPHGTRT